MKKPILFLIAIFTAIPFFVWAQSNYKPGYIITADGKQSNGFINQRAWDNNPSVIEFKPEIDSKFVQTYQASAIKAFGITNGQQFVSSYCKISKASVKIDELANGSRDTSFTADTVFLKVLATGKNITLYEYADYIKVRFFVQQMSQAPTELPYIVYSQGRQVITQNRFVGVLNYMASLYAPQDVGLERELQTEQLKYNAESLIPIVNRINGLNEKANQQLQDYGYVRLFVGLAGANHQLKFTGTYGVAGTANSITPQLSFGVDFCEIPHAKRLFLRVEASVSKGDFYLEKPQAFTVYDILGYRFNSTWVDAKIQFAYHVYDAPKFKVYLAGGLGATKKLAISQQFTQKASNGSLNPLIYNGVLTYNSLGCFYTTQLGCLYHKHWDFFAEYHPNYGVGEAENEVEAQTLSVGVKYLCR